jgi:hypothetical protein
MIVKKHSRNVHEIAFSQDAKLAMLSDIHWDNPHCDRVQLKAHLDYCVKENIPIMINGDFFCFMQGKYDPRRSKGDIRPEHNKVNYIDAVIEDCVSWWKPYAHLLTVIGYGNHETAIIKNLETDPLQRFVDLLNHTYKTQVFTGGYGGWLIVNVNKSWGTSKVNVKYYHGSGGGGLVTKGAINLTRALEMYEGMDVFTMGHIHENSARNDVREGVNFHSMKGHRIDHQNIHLMLTGTYKDEYEDGFGGYHIEKGRPIKPIGGRILNIYTYRSNTATRLMKTVIDSQKFPL